MIYDYVLVPYSRILCIYSQQIIDQKAPGITGQGHIVVHI